ncbi:hypothetical protein WOLCODRAFT_91452 [Wolfiporia cocos MD-104 SS10]|uniref:Helicase ATP-binding domain-containing protein n=1 Tax=Wolfiporia cocos (strain MD-104) TaxID=742152 RepID=A0A2H3J0D5_WOLCO|nr:hypothetical protein WOLCODRAFT_91452 [Wolfiporia cocos MD-104 SS10]
MDLDDFDQVAEETVDSSDSLSGRDSSAAAALEEIDLQWYTLINRRSRWMDLIGDYAGSELFVLDVLTLTILDPRFQLLHAKFILESIIDDFQTRSANFEIVFWQANRHLTLRTGSSNFVVSSRSLCRTVLLHHLQLLDVKIHKFKNLLDPEWIKYSSLMKPMFVMTNDGGVIADDNGPLAAERILTQRVFLFDLLSHGISVSLLRGAECRNSKIMSFVYEQRLDHRAREKQNKWVWDANSAATEALEALEHRMRDTAPAPSLGSAAKQSLHTPSDLDSLVKGYIQCMLHEQDRTQYAHELTFVFVAHLLVLSTLSVRDRARKLENVHPQLLQILVDRHLPRSFCVLERILQNHAIDLDGSVFVAVLNLLMTHPNESLTEMLGVEIGSRLHALWSSLDLEPVNFMSLHSQYPPPSLSQAVGAPARTPAGLLPFSHPLFDNHLAPVQVDVEAEDSVASYHLNFNTIFNDVYHWHNNQRGILPPHLGGEDAQPLDARARARKLRSDQRFMVTMERQAQTLTGAAGIPLERIVILPVGSRPARQERPARPAQIAPAPKEQKKPAKTGKKGKPEQLSSAEKIRRANVAQKQGKEDESNLSWWKDQLREAAQVSTNQQITLVDNLLRNKRTKDGWLAIEARLYRLNLEFTKWVEDSERESAQVRDHAVVQILRMVKDIYQQKSLFPAAVEALDTALTVVGLSSIIPDLKASIPTELDADRALSFKFIKLIKSKTKSAVHKFMHITEDPIVWQLRMFGEFMDRSMDSASDPRVPFKPDAWQRQVLDCLDDNQSVLAVAPTSAGKTFISYYAMEQVLRSSDDGILVYVAPTKALVSQIAAEVYARYRKDLNGRSCWAIHTRDYRIHNPQNCQILVTVPEMLAIMLLSPPLARVWTPRIKRIILDEIHTIGQEEGGAVWEQIILLAPCPIIGLSATIGHPHKFNEWLRSVQEAHGYKHTFIQHPHRYSHLRKFTYHLQQAPATRFNGLDTYKPTNRTRFLHPVSLLAFGVHELPPDFSLEARDCLTLYQAFQSYSERLPPDFDLQALEPSRFFAESSPHLLRQKDILLYEGALKARLSRLIEISDPQDPESALGHIVSQLTDPMVRNAKPHVVPPSDVFLDNFVYFASDLHANGDLPAIFFNFDRKACERMAQCLLNALEDREEKWRETSPDWKHKIRQWEAWKAQARARERQAERQARQKKDADDSSPTETQSSWESTFDPSQPSSQFSYAGMSTAYTASDVEDEIRRLSRWSTAPDWALRALQRGIGVHHAGMNKRYRSLVESLYRVGYLRVVIATGTLALGINAPTRTSVFCGDSPFLTALMPIWYTHHILTAGRRGFDLLGKVIFYGIAIDRYQRLVLSKLPSLGGNFPLTSTMVLRLLNLLQGSENSPYAVSAVKSLLSLPHISFVSDTGKEQVSHFVRFSIDYLRRSGILDAQGNPINLFGVAAHLYYTEPSNLALVALLRNGAIHDICAQKDTFKACRDFMLLMSHLFGRKYLPRTYVTDQNLQRMIKKSPSIVLLPALPMTAKKVLQKHDREIRHVFAAYAWAYAERYRDSLSSEDHLPLSQTTSSEDTAVSNSRIHEHLRRTAMHTVVRSPFVANSGHADEFQSIEELCRSSRRGLRMSQYNIPSMLRFTEETGGEDHSFALNAYLLDFYMHGQTAALKAANGIRDNDVWYLLEDFMLTLKTIRAGLNQLLLKASDAKTNDDDDKLDVDSGYGTAVDVAEMDPEEDNATQMEALKRPPGVSDSDWRVFEIVHSVTNEFEIKFKAMWA